MSMIPTAAVASPTADAPAVAVAELNARQLSILKSSYEVGLLSEQEYQAKLVQWNVSDDDDPLVPRIVRVSGWQTVGKHTTYQLALAAVKADEYGPVKWARSPGNAVDRRFVCIAHTDCTAPLRIWLEKTSGDYLVQTDRGAEHSDQPASKRRKNSVLTYEQEKESISMLQKGIMRISCTYQARIIHITYVYHR